MIRSKIASAMVFSPMTSHQSSTGTCGVKIVEGFLCNQVVSWPRNRLGSLPCNPVVSLSRNQVITLRVISVIL